MEKDILRKFIRETLEECDRLFDKGYITYERMSTQTSNTIEEQSTNTVVQGEPDPKEI